MVGLPPTGFSSAPAGVAGVKGALPLTGVVLIGTLGTLRSLAGQIEGTMPGVVPAGCVLIEGAGNGSWAHGRSQDLPPVLGGLDALVELHARLRFKLALVSLPASMHTLLPRIEAGLKTLGLSYRLVPTLESLLSEPAEVLPAPSAARRLARAAEVDPAVLIGRTHHGLDARAVGEMIAGKRVLITGAGGSIGSELARVAAGFGPESIVLMERAENALFQIDHELGRRFPGVKRHAVMHDVVDAEQTLRLVVKHRPDVVLHSAAHKHVPLMEDHPSHAVNNNLFGTKSIADASVAAGVGRFVMISTDKAVNPTSVMGATKRLAEIYVAGLAHQQAMRGGGASSGGGGSCLSMVRFGNVLGSACSVIPIWTEQIRHGGPVTVTDPRMTRYFMTIPEAATLVAQAAAMTRQAGVAPVYVLDMGEPISIVELAVRLCRLHGLEPRFDAGRLPAGVRDGLLPEALDFGPGEPGAEPIELVFSGARPGEKLHEQLAYAAENLRETSHPGIGCWAGLGADGSIDAGSTAAMIADLSSVRSGGEPGRVHELIRRYVPEMRSSDARGKVA
jgi:FlaA1/EpsC-like NDP-sugar epimerase